MRQIKRVLHGILTGHLACEYGVFTAIRSQILLKDSLPTRPHDRRLKMKSVVIIALVSLALFSIASAQFLTQDEAEEQLSAEGITWSSSGRCTDRNNRRCTSFDNIRQNTISGIISFTRGSGCDVVITGGSETGHSGGANSFSHWNGYKVDIKFTPCVDAYITENFAYIGRRSDGAAQYRSAAGNIYARESSHWDILYY